MFEAEASYHRAMIGDSVPRPNPGLTRTPLGRVKDVVDPDQPLWYQDTGDPVT